MVPTPVTLVGRHVRLEPLQARHAAELAPAAAEKDIWRYLTADGSTPAGLAAWVAGRVAARDAGTALPFLQRDARTSAAFGSTSIFDIDGPDRRAEIGHTWIGASHRRTAANTEAKLLLLRHSFATMALRRVQFKTDARNERSQRAIERLGATREGVLRRHMQMPDGSVRDSIVYSIVDHEWPDVERRLEAFLDDTRRADGPTRPARAPH